MSVNGLTRSQIERALKEGKSLYNIVPGGAVFNKEWGEKYKMLEVTENGRSVWVATKESEKIMADEARKIENERNKKFGGLSYEEWAKKETEKIKSEARKRDEEYARRVRERNEIEDRERREREKRTGKKRYYVTYKDGDDISTVWVEARDKDDAISQVKHDYWDVGDIVQVTDKRR